MRLKGVVMCVTAVSLILGGCRDTAKQKEMCIRDRHNGEERPALQKVSAMEDKIMLEKE